jgi:tetratricopeptide (TPR) repeat protein
MCNAAWYCVERNAHRDLEVILDVAMGIFETSGTDEHDPLIYAHLCNSAGRLWAQQGYFARSLEFMERCRDIRTKNLPAHDEEVWNIHNNLGNVYLSLRDYKKALEEHDFCTKTLPDRNRGQEEWIENTYVNLFNLGRVYTEVGRFSEAHASFDKGGVLINSWYLKVR